MYECLFFFLGGLSVYRRPGIGAGWRYGMSKLGGMGYDVLILKRMVKCLWFLMSRRSLREG